MTRKGEPITILIAYDNWETCVLTREAMEESRLANDIRFVEDGEELTDSLHRRGSYE